MNRHFALAAVLAVSGIVGCTFNRGTTVITDGPAVGEGILLREEPFLRRGFAPLTESPWIGNGVAYGPHRDGQRPGGPSPSAEELREDLRLIAAHWSMLRVYQSGEPAETILRVIRDEGLHLKVLLGVWIAPEVRLDAEGVVVDRTPELEVANRKEVAGAIHLAAAYPGIVIGVSVGNETQIFWSGHRSPPEILIRYVRMVRGATAVPVTVADDFNFWNKPESRAVTEEIDFILMHAHPLWNGILLADALDWTRDTYESIQDLHPELPVVLAETGWATARHTEGDQATLMKGKVGEAEQKVFYDAFSEWSRRNRIPAFFFEAFDENWKGGDHPDEVEKHWGLFRADRTPKLAVAG